MVLLLLQQSLKLKAQEEEFHIALDEMKSSDVKKVKMWKIVEFKDVWHEDYDTPCRIIVWED